MRTHLFLMGLLLAASFAFACSCAPFQSYQEQFDRSGLIFSGKVTSISRVYNGNLVEFEVEKYWKEMPYDFDGKLIVRTGFGGGDCGYGFRQGGEYLVYAYVPMDTNIQKDSGATNICSGTKPLSEAQGDLNWLGEGKHTEVKPKVRPGDNPTTIAFPFMIVGVVVLILGGLVFFITRKKEI